MITVIDGLDMQAELERLSGLVAWAGVDMRPETLHLRVRRQQRRPGRLGFARYRHDLISMTAWPEETRFDAQEVLIHEMTHHYVNRRYGQAAQAHGREFWRHLDDAFQEAYGPITVAPRVNRYHGRYADALRRKAQADVTQDLTERIDQVVAETPTVEDLLPVVTTPTRGSVGWDKLPEPLRSMDREPRLPISHWLDGMNREQGVRVGNPIIPGRDSVRSEKVRPAVQDERVESIITTWRGSTRAQIDQKYEQLHGPFPGKNTYNSIWRLKKAGKVYNRGQRWYPTY